MRTIIFIISLGLTMAYVSAQTVDISEEKTGPKTNIKKTFVFDAQIPLESAMVERVDFGEVIGLQGKSAKSYCEELKSCWVVRLGLGLKTRTGDDLKLENLLSGIFESERDALYWFDSLRLRVKYRGKILKAPESATQTQTFYKYDEVKINYTLADVVIPELAGHPSDPKFKLIANIFSGVWASGTIFDKDRERAVVSADSMTDIYHSFSGYVEYFANQIYVVADPR